MSFLSILISEQSVLLMLYVMFQNTYFYVFYFVHNEQINCNINTKGKQNRTRFETMEILFQGNTLKKYQ